MHINFTPSLNKLGIEILKANYMVLDNNWKAENICDPFTRLYFVKKGSGFIHQGEKKLAILDEHVYIVPAGCTVSYGCDYLEKIWFHIRINGTEKFDMLSEFPSIDALSFPAKSYETLYAALESEDNIKLLSVYTLLYETTFAFAERYTPNIAIPVKHYSALTTALLNEIGDDLRITLTVQELANKLFVSTSKAHKAFQEEVGKTIGKYIDELVFAEAKKLLSDPMLSINDICMRLDFCDRFYFTKRFKELHGLTPAAYRRLVLPNSSKD